jgi:phosphatidylinositol 3-kinase
MVFKSSLFPILVHLKTDKEEHYPIIFKSGDDLRQDQLVIQIIILMDRLLRKENLDLKLTPYRILATSAFTGIVQFVPSMSLAAIEEGKKTPAGVLPYLRSTYPDETTETGVRADVMDNYVKSCAGYSVVTYLLGVGDRHLDNLLLTPDGKCHSTSQAVRTNLDDIRPLFPRRLRLHSRSRSQTFLASNESVQRND